MTDQTEHRQPAPGARAPDYSSSSSDWITQSTPKLGSAREPATTPNTTAYHAGRRSAATARMHTDRDSFVSGKKERANFFSHNRAPHQTY